MYNTIKNILNFRFNPQFKNWDYPDETNLSLLDEHPYVFSHFKYVIDIRGKIYNNNYGHNVLCNPKQIHLLQTNNFAFGSDLYIMGADTHLSSFLDKISEIKYKYKNIYCEAKDIECDFVKAYPCGITYPYLLRCGSDNVLQVINRDVHIKSKNICCCFGSKWPDLNNSIEDRITLKKFANESDAIDFFVCPPTDYYDRIAKYEFMACPIGQGIQTPKIYESLLTHTIPVVIKHPIYKDLKSYGLPIIEIERWENIYSLNYKEQCQNIDWKKVKIFFHVKK